jgi:5-bromo-4-chloroindolyl phosphate hydrolysis protein
MSEGFRTLLSLVVGIGSFLLLNLGLKWNIFVAAGITVLLYFAIYFLTKPMLRIGKVKVDSLKGGEGLHLMMSDAHDDLQVIYLASQSAKDMSIRSKAMKLFELGNQMLTYLSQNPANIPSVRRFFTYYLDTGANILDKYMKLTTGNPNSLEIQRLTPETDKALDTLYDAFMAQFNKLMANEMMDVEADIQLLEKTLKMEG